MAQLVARFHGMEEVRGSNPLSSTIGTLILIQGERPFVLPGWEAFWLVRGIHSRADGREQRMALGGLVA